MLTLLFLSLPLGVVLLFALAWVAARKDRRSSEYKIQWARILADVDAQPQPDPPAPAPPAWARDPDHPERLLRVDRTV